jgi:hypothetical protein
MSGGIGGGWRLIECEGEEPWWVYDDPLPEGANAPSYAEIEKIVNEWRDKFPNMPTYKRQGGLG